MKKFLRWVGCAWLTGFSCLFEDIISPSKWVSGDRYELTGDRTTTSGDRRFPPRSLVKNPFAF